MKLTPLVPHKKFAAEQKPPPQVLNASVTFMFPEASAAEPPREVVIPLGEMPGAALDRVVTIFKGVVRVVREGSTSSASIITNTLSTAKPVQVTAIDRMHKRCPPAFLSSEGIKEYDTFASATEFARLFPVSAGAIRVLINQARGIGKKEARLRGVTFGYIEDLYSGD